MGKEKQSSGKKKAQQKMKEAARLYWAHKKKHPDSKKKITAFVKEVWKK